MQSIIDSYWLEYLQNWKANGKDVSKPPTEPDFWAWYAINHLA